LVVSENGAKLGFGDFDNELANTRKVLERVPEDKLTWRPHAKSMSLGELALHVAGLPWFFDVGVRQPSHDMAGWKKPADPTTRKEIVDKFDQTSAEARKALSELKPEMLGEPWSLKMGDQVFFTLPRAAVLRTFALSHIIHHRAQLVVYLRLLDVPIPGLYGPSADEQ
jgi:uncharacterized damage-inducible protein DinB